MVDSHTHLHLCEGSPAELVNSALEVGVSRMVTVGTDAESCRAALAAAEQFPGVYAAIGRHPTSATGFGDTDLADLQELAAHERCVAIGETGLDYYRRPASRAVPGAPAEDQRRAFLAQIELARSTGKPLVIHTRAADEDTLELLDAHADGVPVILHCFSMAARVEQCLSHPDWWFSFAGNSTYPKAEDLRLAALRVPAERLLVETDAPYLAPQAVRGQRNQPSYVVHTAQAMALERGVPYLEFDRAIEASAAVVFGW